MKTVGEVAVKIVPKMEEGNIKATFKRVAGHVKKAFQGTMNFFGKAGGFMQGLNQTLEVMKKIKSEIEKMRGIVTGVTQVAAELSDFAQAVGLGGGKEYQLVHILSQLTAGGIGVATGKQLIEQLSKRIASGQVQVEKGLGMGEAFVSAMKMIQGAKSEPERLQLFAKLFGKDISASGDIIEAITAYGTHSAERLGEAGTKEGLQRTQNWLSDADFTMSEIEHNRWKTLVKQGAYMGAGKRVIDPETGLSNNELMQSLITAAKLEDENKLLQLQETSANAIVTSAEVMANIEKMMNKAAGIMGETIDKTLGLIQGIKDVLDRMASGEIGMWDVVSGKAFKNMPPQEL